MGDLIVFMSLSLDGFVAAEHDGPGMGLGRGGEDLHGWLTAGNIEPTSYRPESGVNAAIFDRMVGTGAVVVGRHTFEWAGEWGGDHHDGVPIFVLTRTPPDPPAKGIVQYLSEPGVAVEQAKRAAGGRDVLMHGASSVQALLRLGLVDVLQIALVPILIGRGRRLFEDAPIESMPLKLTESLEGDGALHLRYRFVR